MNSIPIYQVDAFAKKLFSGNPAAICIIEEWLPDETRCTTIMQYYELYSGPVYEI